MAERVVGGEVHSHQVDTQGWHFEEAGFPVAS